MTNSIILSSSSASRKMLLKRLELPFSTAKPAVDETRLPDEPPVAMVIRLSIAKAQAVAKQFPNSLIIGSDIVMVLDNKFIGKPGNHEEAVKQLQKSSGKCMTSYTGVCLLNTATDNLQIDVAEFRVYFRKLTNEMIENYLRREQPYQCAGSIMAEKLGIVLFEKLAGDDITALIGLPLIKLTRMLENEDVKVL